MDVIFLHGLTGSAEETWGSGEESGYWPEWVSDDLINTAVYTLGYPLSIFKRWAQKEMDIFERATAVLEYLVSRGFGARPLVIICHSLGGILAKVILRKALESGDEDYQRISKMVRLVAFIAVPHKGSGLANLADVIPGTSSFINLLSNKTGFLQDLNQHYRNFADSQSELKTVVYYEKHATKNSAIVVDRESSDPGVSGAEPIAVDKNHIEICKPRNKEDLLYVSISRHIKKIIEMSRTDRKEIKPDFQNRHDSDRRDLLQKLMDAGREHEYQYANEVQNEFARSFVKTGLFTTARSEHEDLLEEVQTRFMNHIFHPLICTEAEDTKIKEAIQTHILDPLTARKFGETKFGSRSIMSALYFLTEQCHISWDYES